MVDRTRSTFLAEGQAFYLDRLKRYAQIEWIETKPSSLTKGKSARKVLAEEAEGVIKKIPAKDYVIALDRRGRTYESEKLALRIDRLCLSHSDIVFVIGGPLGLDQKILDRADETLSLSKLTLTHEMSRLILLEQLYRAFTIMKGEQYHK